MPNTDEAKGRAKQAAGALTDDEELQAEGQADETAGKAKKAVDSVANAVKDKLDR